MVNQSDISYRTTTAVERTFGIMDNQSDISNSTTTAVVTIFGIMGNQSDISNSTTTAVVTIFGIMDNQSSVPVSTATSSDTPTTSSDDEMDACGVANKVLDLLFIYFCLASVVVTFGLSFIVRRKALWRKCCWGRPGTLQPVNFVDEVDRRWAYAACFVILTYNVMLLFTGESNWHFMDGKTADWMAKFGWVSVFNKLFEALTVCLVYYPMLSCINRRRAIAANVIGILIVIPWIVFYSDVLRICYDYVEPKKGLKGVRVLLFRIPIYIAFYVIGFSYILDLVINVREKIKRRRTKFPETLSKSKREFKVNHHLDYVSVLLRRKDTSEDVEAAIGLRGKLLTLSKRAKYDRIFGFRYSTRLICSFTICVTILIWLVVFAAEKIEDLSGIFEIVCYIIGKFQEHLCEDITTIKVVAHVCNAVSALVIMLLLLNSLITYKRCWHQLLRGDHSWHMYGTTIVAPHSMLLNGLKYAGYQVAFAIWGWVVLTIVLWLLLVFFTFAFIIPVRVGMRNWFIQMLINLWPTVFLGVIFIPLIQYLICRFLFLQDKGKVFALNNRRLYNATSYYFIILNIIVGIFSCLKRILIPLVLGIVFLSRLDRPLIMKGFETKDPGYVAFVSMLLVDLYHNHPVVKTFVDLLLEVKESRVIEGASNDPEAVAMEQQNRRSKLIRNRWRKTVTLVNNPPLALQNLERRLRETLDRKRLLTPTAPELNQDQDSTTSTLPVECEDRMSSYQDEDVKFPIQDDDKKSTIILVVNNGYSSAQI